jgi:hypothetical protein
MARIKIEDVLEHLGSDLTAALSGAVREVMPHSRFDEHQLFHAFVRAAGAKCATWETVPDKYVEKEQE